MTTSTVLSVFFFSSRRRHTRCGRDWSSDVCSSDLQHAPDLDRLKLREPRGVLVRRVMPGEPADKGGVRANDVIIGIDGLRLETPRDLQRVVSSTPVGKRVRVALLRDGLETEVEVTIGLYQDSEAATPEPSERTPRRPAPVPR